MAKRYAKDEYHPKNPQKYTGKYPIIYRSSWEMTMMQKLDDHPNVVWWSSESLSIRYWNPLKKAWSNYIPDFLVGFVDKYGRNRVEMIEVKPMKEVPGVQQGRMSEATKLVQIVNAAKWTAAMAYCRTRGWHFRVATEQEMFAYKRK